MMFVQLNPKHRSFGADDHPVCPRCANRMGLTRRGPNSLDPSQERQIFSCRECDYEAARVVDVGGRAAA